MFGWLVRIVAGSWRNTADWFVWEKNTVSAENLRSFTISHGQTNRLWMAMKGTHNDIIFSKNEGFGIFRWYVPSYFDDAWNEWSSSIAWWWYVYRHKETKQSTPPAQNSFWKIKKTIIIREKKRAAGFRFAPKSVLTFHATLKQEKKAFVCRTYACWHPHDMCTGTNHHCTVRGTEWCWYVELWRQQPLTTKLQRCRG